MMVYIVIALMVLLVAFLVIVFLLTAGYNWMNNIYNRTKQYKAQIVILSRQKGDLEMLLKEIEDDASGFSVNTDELQQNLALTEEKLNVAHLFFHDAFTKYNMVVKQFPLSLLARFFHFEQINAEEVS